MEARDAAERLQCTEELLGVSSAELETPCPKYTLESVFFLKSAKNVQRGVSGNIVVVLSLLAYSISLKLW